MIVRFDAWVRDSWTRIAVATGLLWLLTFSWATTESLAYAYDFPAWMGKPWLSQPIFTAGRVVVYRPVACVGVAWTYGPGFMWDHVVRGFWAASIFAGVVFVVRALDGLPGLPAVKTGWFKKKPASDLHGSARWATTAELTGKVIEYAQSPSAITLCRTEDAAIRPNKDKVTGQETWTVKRAGRLLGDAGEGHVYVQAPPRHGKGVGCVNPTLLDSWRDGCLVFDVKGALHRDTSGARLAHLNHKVLRFQPTAMDSPVYNPLMEVRRGVDHEVKDVERIATHLFDNLDDHWKQTGSMLVSASILHVLYAEQDKSLAGVFKLWTQSAEGHKAVLARMASFKHMGACPNEYVRNWATHFGAMDERELSGVVSTMVNGLRAFADPVVAHATSGRSDWCVADLRASRPRPLTVYLVVALADIERLRPLLRVVIGTVISLLTEKEPTRRPDGTIPRVLLVLDEFRVLQNLSVLTSSIGLSPSYGLRYLLVSQDLAQLEDAYGAQGAHALIAACATKLFLGAGDDKTADYVSRLLGPETRVTEKTSEHRDRPGVVVGSSAWREDHRATQETGRPLMTPAEVLHMSQDRALLFMRGHHPYRPVRFQHYTDPNYKRLADAAPLSPTEEVYLRHHERQELHAAGIRPMNCWDGFPAPASAPAAPKSAAAPQGQAEDESGFTRLVSRFTGKRPRPAPPPAPPAKKKGPDRDDA